MHPHVEKHDLVFQKTGYSQSSTHPWTAECDSRQTIQTRPNDSDRIVPPPRSLPSNMLPVAPAPGGSACHQVQNKLPQFVLTVLDPQAWAVDALSLSWEDLDPYAFPPAAILDKVEKLQDYPCSRIILIAPGWPNMHWFWDLVVMSSQIPLYLANLLTQPFSQTLHRNLSIPNLHAWLLKPQL